MEDCDEFAAAIALMAVWPYRVVVRGASSLRGIEHRVSGDRIETGTLLLAGIVTGGDVTVTGADPPQFEAVVDKLREAGADVQTCTDAVRARCAGRWSGSRPDQSRGRTFLPGLRCRRLRCAGDDQPGNNDREPQQ